MNSFGRKFRVSIFGESHGAAVGALLDGVPAGVGLDGTDFAVDLARRRPGAPGTTPRVESDAPQIVSGVSEGKTTGAPIAILFENQDVRSGDYDGLRDHPRPSHADWVARQKFGESADLRGGGHFSGRLTLPLVAAGVVAKKLLKGIDIEARIVETGDVEAAIKAGDSVGGIIECRAAGLPAGLGEPFFDSVESLVAHALFAIPGIKGVEFGAGFAAARMRGSEHNDRIIGPDGRTATNHAGGIVGGITNGNELVVRVALKPTASIALPQQTLNIKSGQIEELRIAGRHDACIALRASVVVEAAVAIVLADLKLLGLEETGRPEPSQA